jgi:hypothetical protein
VHELVRTELYVIIIAVQTIYFPPGKRNPLFYQTVALNRMRGSNLWPSCSPAFRRLSRASSSLTCAD